MLVLSRKKGEDLVIISPKGEVIKIGVWKELNTSNIKIYLDAPETYKILRKELYERDFKKF